MTVNQNRGANDSGEEGQLLINHLPDEILQHILFFCTPHDVLLAVQLLSKRFNRVCNEPLLWRHHCRVDFEYWDSKHRIVRKLAGKVGDVDWKSLFIYRWKVDKETADLLESILAGQVNRISKFKTIADFGYDAKDTLLRHCRAPDTAEDVLARRYYATAVLDHVHRSNALAEWAKVLRGESVSLERALGAFDLFVIHDQKGDLNEISDLLDDLVARLRKARPGLDNLTPRRKSIEVVSFLRQHNILGLSSEDGYRDLQNIYMGVALQDPEHPSLPLTSVAIFCAVAQRVGLDARCCGIPNHVHAMVLPVPGQTMDGTPAEGGENPSVPMYLDPYRSEKEVELQSLQMLLSDYGIKPHQYNTFLADSSTKDSILRTSRNIISTVQEYRVQASQTELAPAHPTIRIHGNPFSDLDSGFYSALWANYMFGNSGTGFRGTNQSQFIPLILERFERLYPMDASLIEQYILPFHGGLTTAEHRELGETVRVVRAADQTPRQVRLRKTRAASGKATYKVGQVFRHKRFGYIAVLTGWDLQCGQTSEWMTHHNVDSLSRGRHQSFYHAFVEDTTIRYVAEENIEIIEPEVPTSLMGLAGKFFKRWDAEKRVFVSNIRDEYPED